MKRDAYEILGVERDASERDIKKAFRLRARELQSLSIVASSYGLPARQLGAVSVIGPVRMDYGSAIASVRQAADELSRFVGELYE